MCGFFFLKKDKENFDFNKLKSYSSLLKHRGPDDDKVIENDKYFVRFFRLSIMDTSKKGSQPMFDKTKRFFLVFNGEIYNFKSLKKKLRNNSIKSNSDTEVLLYTLIERGIESINDLEGMFSFIFYDTLTNTLFTGRDRFGIKPFYYTYINRSIAFSSEIKPLLNIKKDIQLNNLAFCNFFLKGSMDFDKETFFNQINSVEPGTYGIFKNDKVTFKKYWALENSSKNYTQRSNFKKSSEQLEVLLKNSLNKHLISDRKIGLFLSGGTDSNALLNLISKSFSEKKLNTFTYGFENASSYDESTRVRKLVTNSKNIDNFYSYLRPNEIIESFEKTTKILESPFTSIRIFAMKKLYQLARKKGCRVILEGDGGDEIFGGYDYNVYSYLKDKFINKRNHQNKIVNHLKKFIKISGRNNSHIINLILTNNYQFSSTSDGTIFVNSDFFKQTFLDENISEKFYKYNRIKKLNFLKNSQLKDISYIKLPRSLKYKDRLSMSEGIETRVPLLDHPLAEYCFNLPNEYKFKDNISRFIFKQVAKKKYFSKYKFEVSKKTIADPQKIWMKTHLKEYFLDAINSTTFKNLDYFNHKIIKSEFLKFCKEENYPSTFAFFQILSFYNFYKIFFKNN
jgi:asparagine synthase (glutamine-hydrolysing)